MTAVARSLSEPATLPLAHCDRPIDLVHLARMTLGERSLEREVLQLFARQAELLVARMGQADPAAVATLAHTLKGSAKGIGAWQVVRAAEGLEQDAQGAGRDQAMRELRTAVDEATAFISQLLLPN